LAAPPNGKHDVPKKGDSFLNGGTLVFDLETKNLAHEVGGWTNINKLGLAVAVLLHVETGEISKFVEQEAGELIAKILGADRVVGFNVKRFDYEVLRPYGLVQDPGLIQKTIDLLDHIYNYLGFRLSLDNLAEATLNESKSADGIIAVRWFREGKIDQVLDYCEQDVHVTHRLWEYGRENGYINYRDRDFRIQRVPVTW
jgi:DEAD/DEAH box helicase domain-containing protein